MSAACEIIIPAFGFCRTTRAERDRVPQELFFKTVQRDHYSYTRLNRAAINELRTAPSASGDEEAAHALIDLLIDDLPQDPEHDGLMDNSETGAVIRCLKAVLRRLGIEFEVPFHDKQGYYSFRMEHNNGLITDLTRVFAPARAALERREQTTFTGGLRGLRGELRNLIFAAAQKPEIVWRDVAGGVIEITKNKDHCLLYDRPVGASGLTWEVAIRFEKLREDSEARMKQCADAYVTRHAPTAGTTPHDREQQLTEASTLRPRQEGTADATPHRRPLPA
jgi:hypothetical protein